jgi:hypothetical protein
MSESSQSSNLSNMEMSIVIDMLSSRYQTPFEETAFSAINGTTFDRSRSSLVYHKAYAGDLFNKENQLYLIIGSDGGLILNFIAEVAKKGQRFLVVDYQKIIEWIEENIKFDSDLIELLPANGDLSVLSSEKYQAYFYRNSISIQGALCVVDQVHPNYVQLWETYQANLNHYFYLNLVDIHGSSGFINAQLINIADNQHSIHLLYQQFVGGVAMLLAGGPSLDDSITWIKKNRSKVTLFAVGRIAARLMKEKIVPDFICSVDPTEASFDNSRHLLKLDKHVIFLHAFHVNPRLLSQWKGRSFYHGRRFPWMVKESDADKQLFAPGPTVTNTLLAFITHMGFEQIIFSGVDLCFKSDGQSHESHSIENKVGRHVHKSTQTLMSNEGLEVPTSTDFYTAHQVLVAQVASILHHFPKVQLVNHSGGAARVEGVEYLPLSQLQLADWQCDVSAHVDRILLKKSGSALAFYKKTYKTLSSMKVKLFRVNAKSTQAIKLLDKLFVSEEATLKYSKQLLAAKEAIEFQLKDSLPLLFDYEPTAFHDAMLIDTNQEQTQEQMIEAFNHYFSAVNKSSLSLTRLLDYAMGIVKLRELEMNTQKLTSELINGWITYGQPGRLYVWLTQHQRSISRLSSAEKALAQPMIKLFDGFFQDQSTQIEDKFRKYVHVNLLDKVEQAVINLTEDNILFLQNTLTICEDHAGKDGFYRDLGLFIWAYFNEIKQKSDEAYQLWAMIKEPSVMLLAMRRQMNYATSVSNIEKALEAVQALCALDRRYLPAYAGILKQFNWHDQAVEVLQTYLRYEPSDIAASIQLVQLWFDMQQADQACNLLETMSKAWPENPIVQSLSAQCSRP